MNTFSKILLAILVMTLFGCSGYPVKVESVTDSTTIDKTRGRKIYAQASGFQLFLVIPIQINSRHERAYGALMNAAGGDSIADLNVKESWTYALVGTLYTTTMEATVYPKIRK